MSGKEVTKEQARALAMSDEDMVNHPSHYCQGDIEVIDAIEDWKLGYHEGNVVKYVARACHKQNRLEDLKKAQWYLTRLIEKLKKEGFNQ